MKFLILCFILMPLISQGQKKIVNIEGEIKFLDYYYKTDSSIYKKNDTTIYNIRRIHDSSFWLTKQVNNFLIWKKKIVLVSPPSYIKQKVWISGKNEGESKFAIKKIPYYKSIVE